MGGIRTTGLMLVMALAVALFPRHTQRPPALDMIEARNGLAVMRHEVSIAQWRQCFAEGGCSFMPAPAQGALDESFPATGIGALDAAEFVTWAQERIDPRLRLPTIAEWYGFSGVTPYRPKKIFTDPRLAWAATYGAEGKIDPTLRAPGGFGTNAAGIADVKGNVWEWTSSCVVAGGDAHCPAYFAAGEHEAKVPVFVRDPSAGGCATGTPPAHLGLRLVRADLAR
jgi:formylglycine-generating enzyme required for sulfatase activity